ncbi:hypothetical protein BDY21DRAFT_340370 [Lineolata rhizophorae]|uniref:Transmembrane protein n=1 Tax=Lineolata rhizophorae TaxID=578093 RepID=A0A6A6P3Z0_9PEZI|nr:hypothetical protein BDY21DRAFT_340370 [Lineolata rhizophorae]
MSVGRVFTARGNASSSSSYSHVRLQFIKYLLPFVSCFLLTLLFLSTSASFLTSIHVLHSYISSNVRLRAAPRWLASSRVLLSCKTASFDLSGRASFSLFSFLSWCLASFWLTGRLSGSVPLFALFFSSTSTCARGHSGRDLSCCLEGGGAGFVLGGWMCGAKVAY